MWYLGLIMLNDQRDSWVPCPHLLPRQGLKVVEINRELRWPMDGWINGREGWREGQFKHEEVAPAVIFPLSYSAGPRASPRLTRVPAGRRCREHNVSLSRDMKSPESQGLSLKPTSIVSDVITPRYLVPATYLREPKSSLMPRTSQNCTCD